VALTFDDGLEEHLEIVAPLLERLGARATFYVPSSCLGRSASEVGYPGRHVDAAGLRRLAAAGFEVGSHSRSHPVLARCGRDRLRDEIAGSRDDLGEILGTAPASFAYPFGSRRTFTPEVVEAVAAAGYSTAACTVIGGNSADMSPFELRRVPVYQSDDGPLALAKARGAMDWLGGVQESWLRLFPHHSTR
jgi:peptidoglycan/xylan/chitin deacetylase (PgdA/CDA1 family)